MESRRIDTDSIVDVVFHLKWKSDAAIHADGYQASRINIWRDFFPPDLLEKIFVILADTIFYRRIYWERVG